MGCLLVKILKVGSSKDLPFLMYVECPHIAKYEIIRTGYHEMEDTLPNIDLDYGAAIAAISMETVAWGATS